MNVSQKRLNKKCRELKKGIYINRSYRKIRVEVRMLVKVLERIGIKTII